MARKEKILGDWGEKYAACYLQRIGYVIVDRNYHVRGGEIDIIAYERKNRYLVFVEVKVRTAKTFGTPEESIGIKKKIRLSHALESYVAQKTYTGNYRFDVISIVIEGPYHTLKHTQAISFE